MENKYNEEKEFGDVIKEIRKSMGKSLGEVYKDTGITPTYIWRIEGKSRINISVKVLRALIEYYKLDEDYIKRFLRMPVKEQNDNIIEILKNENYKFGNEFATVIKRIKISELFRKIEEYATKDKILRKDDAEILDRLDGLRKEYKNNQIKE